MNKNKRFIGAIVLVVSFTLFLIGGFVLNKINGAESYKAGDKELLYSSGVSKGEDKDVSFKNEENVKNKESSNSENVIEGNRENTNNTSIIKVDVKGAINKPGIYSLKEGDRIDDLLKLCGGLTNDADANRVYFSKKLCDEDIIYIFKNGESEEEVPKMNISSENNGANNVDNKNSNKTSSGKININTANLEELKTLSGIGDSKAQAIIDYREKNGGFKDVSELRNVEGIGEKTLNKFIDSVDIK